MRLRSRRGFVLLVALLAIVLTGALVTAAAFRVGELGHVARTTTLDEVAFADAEAALWGTVASADAATLRMLPIGGTAVIAGTANTTDVVVMRTDATMYWLVATARYQRVRDVARRRVGVSATLSSELSSDGAGARLNPAPSRGWVALY